MIQENKRSIASSEDVFRYSQDSLGKRKKIILLGAAYELSLGGADSEQISKMLAGSLRKDFTQEYTYQVEPQTMKELQTRALFQFDKQDPDRMAKRSDYCMNTKLLTK